MFNSNDLENKIEKGKVNYILSKANSGINSYLFNNIDKGTCFITKEQGFKDIHYNNNINDNDSDNLDSSEIYCINEVCFNNLNDIITKSIYYNSNINKIVITSNIFNCLSKQEQIKIDALLKYNDLTSIIVIQLSANGKNINSNLDYLVNSSNIIMM